jgi:hypothetical protein
MEDELKLETYIEVSDNCPFCSQPKRRLVLQSHPKYEGSYDTKCGYCGMTPRIEAERCSGLPDCTCGYCYNQGYLKERDD